MKYTPDIIVKIASQIDKMESEGNARDIKLKSGVNPQQFKQDLIALGFAEEDFDTETLKYTYDHKDYTWSVMDYNGGHATEKTDFFIRLEQQMKRIAAINVLRQTGGVELSAAEKKYVSLLDMQMAGMALGAKQKN